MSSELTNLRELVRRGDLDAARELSIPDDDRAVAAIYLALAAGDVELALGHAVECFDHGRALRVVAATIVAYGPQDKRWHQAADALAIIDALTAAAEQPNDPAICGELVELLVEDGQRELAWATVRAANHGEPTLWKLLVTILVEAGDPLLALGVARDAMSRFPRDNDLAAMRALLAIETGLLGEAEALITRDERLDCMMQLARARLAIARGDLETAARAARAAIEGGIPEPIVSANARGGQVLLLLRGAR